ncbi:GIY-YIG nuclease family protein [Candidatus Uhrbacteria bacterium]|nr:GIY-YIG nuclease family protein [Candidatus Uhrbacteria bacterium]
MTNRSKTLYTGVTSDLIKRVWQHKQKFVEGFTKRYNIDKLVYYELTESIVSAIACEKQIKGWIRAKKITLIESQNPLWKDLSEDWYDEARSFVGLRMTVVKRYFLQLEYEARNL